MKLTTTQKKLIAVLVGCSSLTFSACQKEGCTDPIAENYNSAAKVDDGSCTYIKGCMDESATNYKSNATKDDGSCTYEGYALFWTNCDVCSYINVYVDGTYVGNTTGWYSSQPSAPNCQALYCVSLALEPGSYAWSGQETSTGITLTGSLTIQANTCTMISL